MKVLLELLGDTSRVLENVNGLEDFRPESRQRVSELLIHLASESDRILSAEVADEAQGPGERHFFVEKALKAISNGEYREARACLEDGLEAYPGDFEMLNHLGLVAWEQDQLREAEVAYAKAMDVVFEGGLDTACVEGPADPALRAVEGRALALYRVGDFNEALGLFEWLGEHFPSQYVGCRYLAGEIHHLQGSLEVALKWYDEVPVEPAVLYNKGLALYQSHRVEEAAFTLVKAFVSNIHIATGLLGRYTPKRGCTPGYLGSERYANEFVDACRRLWHQAKGSLRFLQVCFDHRRVEEHLRRCSEQGGQHLLQGAEGSMNCHGWLSELQDDRSLEEMANAVATRFCH